MRETKPKVLREEQEGGSIEVQKWRGSKDGWQERKGVGLLGVVESKCIAVDVQNCFVVESNVIVIC